MENSSLVNSNSPEDKVIEVVQRILHERSIPNVQPIDKDHKLTEFGLKSLDLARLVLLVEDEFDLRIPVRDLIPANFRSISTISQLIGKLTSTHK
jgi:acyl carrier protein